jgi:alpha/beta superfamily hydrolase
LGTKLSELETKIDAKMDSKIDARIDSKLSTKANVHAVEKNSQDIRALESKLTAASHPQPQDVIATPNFDHFYTQGHAQPPLKKVKRNCSSCGAERKGNFCASCGEKFDD